MYVCVSLCVLRVCAVCVRVVVYFVIDLFTNTFSKTLFYVKWWYQKVMLALVPYKSMFSTIVVVIVVVAVGIIGGLLMLLFY